MTAHRDPDRLIRAFLLEGQTELADPVYDAVRATIEHKRQRVLLGPWRMPNMSKFVSLGLGAAAVVVALGIGSQLLATPSGVGGATAIGGTVEYVADGGPTTTEVDAVAEGASVSGTAVTTSAAGTHTVAVACAADYGDTWALGGKVEESTVEPFSAGTWSAVIVKEGSPQQIAIHFSTDESDGDCEGSLAAIDYSTIDPSNFHPVTSGALVPPPGDAMSRPFE